MVKKIKSDTEIVKELITKLLELVGISAKVEVSEDKENDAINVHINAGEEAGLIIGGRGRTINSIQVILGIMFRRKKGQWRRIVVDVSDWRKRERQRLIELAHQVAERVKASGEAQYLYNLSAAQRRIIHLSLSEDKAIKTESVGEGKDRYLVVSPNK